MLQSRELPADFCEVDMGASRVLCELAKIKKTPVVHIYKQASDAQTNCA